MAGKITKESVWSKLRRFHQLHIRLIAMTNWMPGESCNGDPVSCFLYIKLGRKYDSVRFLPDNTNNRLKPVFHFNRSEVWCISFFPEH